MKLKEFNEMDEKEAFEVLSTCCGSTKWVSWVASHRPYRSMTELFSASDAANKRLSESDWLEAFRHHPRIGDTNDLKKKFGRTAELSAKEQSSVSAATDDMIQELKDYNDAYYEKHGFIFIICASGKSAAFMLEALKSRIDNSTEDEIDNAAGEQAAITRLRLEKLFQ